MNKETKELPELISAYTFAERKDVSNTAVYGKILKGEIIPVQIGKHKYIDWNEFKHVTFPVADKRKANKTPFN